MPLPITQEIAEQVFRGEFLPCSYIHDGSCEATALRKLISVGMMGLKFYIPVHILPIILFKRKKFSEK